MTSQPKKFLSVINTCPSGEVIGLTACAGFELDSWRAKKLAEHLMNWLPHFALRPSEIANIGAENAFSLIKNAAYRIYETGHSETRGEIGELLLHILSVTEYRAHAFVSRLYYKMRSNDQITGFDSALVTVDENSGEVELWLGEAKFYKDAKGAVNAAVSSIQEHLDEGFLEETKILVGPKIEPDSPGYDRLQWLFDDRNKLDELIERIVVPVLIAAESDAAMNYIDIKASYPKIVIEEYESIAGRLSASGLAKKVKIVLIYVPLASKENLVAEFDGKLRAFK